MPKVQTSNWHCATLQQSCAATLEVVTAATLEVVTVQRIK